MTPWVQTALGKSSDKAIATILFVKRCVRVCVLVRHPSSLPFRMEYNFEIFSDVILVVVRRGSAGIPSWLRQTGNIVTD